MTKLSQILSTTIWDRNDPPTDRILMDNCANVSTASSALAPDSLTQSEKPVRVSCIAGFVNLDHEITYGGFAFKAHDELQENVLSQGDLEAAGYRVQYDSEWGHYKVSKNKRDRRKVYKDKRDGLSAFNITSLF